MLGKVLLLDSPSAHSPLQCSPVALDLLSMDTSDRVHEISRVVYSPVTVS